MKYPIKDALIGDFQTKVDLWMLSCFGEEISKDKLERGDRFLEESLELLQSGGYSRERVQALTDYVYNRPIGDPEQEVGGVSVTLAAYCSAHDLRVKHCAEKELDRIWDNIDKIREKQANKPTGSALPISETPKYNIKDLSSEIISKSIEFARDLNDYAGRPVWEQAIEKAILHVLADNYNATNIEK